MRNFIKTTLAVASLALSMGAAAITTTIPGTLDIDFRSADWGTAIGADATGTPSLDGVTLETRPRELEITHWNDDGVGIKGDQIDEIDDGERLLVIFDSAIDIAGIWITDLFAKEGFPNGEEGWYNVKVAGSAWSTHNWFFGKDSQGDNGEQYLELGLANVDRIIFGVTTGNGGTKPGHEFSVAGITTVPEPSSLILLSLGLMGLGAARSSSRKSS